MLEKLCTLTDLNYKHCLFGVSLSRWSEVTRRIEMWISIQELNEMGEYTAVELHQAKDVNTGGIFQLRQVLSPFPALLTCFKSILKMSFLISLWFFWSLIQGHSRRVQVTVKPVQHSGTLPLMVEAILSVSIGCVTARSTKLQRGLDSYQVGQLVNALS